MDKAKVENIMDKIPEPPEKELTIKQRNEALKEMARLEASKMGKRY